MKRFSPALASVLEDERANLQSSSIFVDLAVSNTVARAAFESVIKECTDFRILKLSEQVAPQVTILEVNSDPQRALATIQSLDQSPHASEYFLTGESPDSAVLLEALRVGVKEFFPLPVDRDAVRQALKRYGEARASAPCHDLQRSGQLVSVMGSSGGLGTTSLAVNLAVSLKARETGKSVVLVEVDQQNGNLPAYLDLTPSYSFQDINSDLLRLDDALVRKFLLDHSSGIQVLPSGYNNLRSGQLNPVGVKHTMELLALLFDYVIVDIGHTLDAPAREALSLSNLILLVSTLQVPVVHRTQGLLQEFVRQGIEGAVELVMSRYCNEEEDLIEETESVLGHGIDWRIPENSMPSRHSINQGTPCVSLFPKTPIAKSYAELASRIAGRAISNLPAQGPSYGHFQKLLQFGRAKLNLAKAS
ncbi:AAA family ATPase [Candidatus Nitronereus thalassa]|uniref:AAA family ATPase n=1 Tax=Candidatus Nitronereus thalassa TaxID=3020898 RepID=A0ABU3KAF1_9BACT|nr:AAA family ATPase [Candidatus Nitronereus thalassa]MDT7043450.1 AAA family ATPase [Candidatus Nitronereus thalassa]